MNTERALGIVLLIVCAALLITGWTLAPSLVRTACILGGIGTGMGGVWMLTLKYASR